MVIKKSYKYLSLVFLFLSFFAGSQEIPEITPELLEKIKETNQTTVNDIVESEDFSVDKKEIVFDVKSNVKSKIFGLDFIASSPTSISTSSDLPLPNNYIISLNDVIRIVLTGSKKSIFDVTVGMDGNLLLPELGEISVAGLTIEDFRKKLENLVDVSYVGAQVDFSIISLSAKKINIIGAVKNPGTYIVNPFTTILNALAYSGGVEEYASLRAIKLVKPNGTEQIFDLYDFLIAGDRSKDMPVSAGDTIVVNGTSKLVEVSGSVIRPKIYEYKQNDSFADLIDFALGLSRNGNDRNITATVNENGRKFTMKIDKESLIRNQDVEALYIGSSVIVDSKDVFVSGNAVTSGFYASSNEKLTKFLDKIRFSSEIYPFYAIYKNTSANGLSRDISSFSLSDPESYSNLSASKNTELSFFSRDEILDRDETLNSDETLNRDKTLDIDEISSEALGQISKDDFISISFPDRILRIPVKGKISPKQIHGFFESVGEIDEKKVSAVTSKDTYTNAYEDIFDSEDLVAISFPSIKNENLIEVSIQGEVFNPGTYLVSSSTKLSDLYILSGGLRNNAYENGISLFREEVKQKQLKAIREAKAVLTDAMIQKSNSISDRNMVDIQAIIQLADLIEPNGRIAGQFYESSEITKNFTLKDGDSVVIPSMSYSVVVHGEVLNSSSFIFDKSMNHKDYIQAAGGFSDYADKRSVFIIKSNGLSVLAGSSVFSGQIKIEPGDTIVVPRDLDQLEALPLVSMATKIIADIAFSAASLNAISD
tara:strand:+ start:250 stop:2547 length:2298 start_codon:yes stop_codon:yes gene_type:complete